MQKEQNKKEPESKNDSAKYITKQENPEFDIQKEQINEYEKMNNEVYTGEVLPVDSEEVKNAIDIDAEKSAKAYYEHKKKEEEINRLKAQRNMYVQMIPTENNNRSMGM